MKRRGWDSNPRGCYPYTISSRAHSTGLCHLSLRAKRLTTLVGSLIDAQALMPMGAQISTAQALDPGPKADIQQATAVIRDSETQAIALKTLTGR